MRKICGLVGSLRKGSFNRGLMLAAQDAGSTVGLEVEIFERLDEIPLYNSDYDTDPLRPASVNALKSAIADASGLIVATPEYNYSVPGGLKNAIDWASRPAGKSCLNRKPAAIMGASIGISGTIRAQLALRQSFLHTDTFALLQPEVLIPKCTDRFDENGILVDQSTRDLVARQMTKFAVWIDAVEAMVRAGAT
ncbi:MAG: NAD(P)H-dependent oxidoreductase [Gemmatimonadota bacterium]|nr:NAD(P)H-dependent oxidoreductase [Gemmatimonadota bacterium]